MKYLCTAISVALLLAGCSLQANAVPTHQLEWVVLPETTTEPTAEPPPPAPDPAAEPPPTTTQPAEEVSP